MDFRGVNLSGVNLDMIHRMFNSSTIFSLAVNLSGTNAIPGLVQSLDRLRWSGMDFRLWT